MRHRLIDILLAGSIMIMCLGCGTGAFQKGTGLDRDWGKSYEIARTQQILNPATGENLDTVEGVDGDGALRSLEHYREGFEQAEKGSGTSITLTPVGTVK